MKTLDAQMVNAWRTAASELSVRLSSPYRLRGDDGKEIEAEGFLPDFGGPDGMVFISSTRDAEITSAPHSSVLFENYRTFSRDLFAATLNDWGWYGPSGQEPPWYTGRPWTE